MNKNWRKSVLLVVSLFLILLFNTILVYSLTTYSNFNSNISPSFFAPRAPQDQVFYDGFEDWTQDGPSGPPDGWNDGSVCIKTEQENITVYSGNHAVKLNESTASGCMLYHWEHYSAPNTLAPGVYQLSFYVKNVDPVAKVALSAHFDSDTWYSFFGNWIAGTSDWERLYINCDCSACPEPITLIDMRLQVDLSGNNQGVYVDECSIDEVITSEFPSLVLFLPTIISAIVFSIWLLNRIKK